MGQLNTIATNLKLLSDPNRLKLVACLKQGELCLCDLVEVLQISQPAVSQQMKKLKDGGIVTERKIGTWKYFTLQQHQEPYIQHIIDELEIIPIKCKSCN